MRKALVSLAVGDRCFGPWSRYLRGNWSAWCDRHGYDLIVFDSLLDNSPRGLQRSPAWQKLLAMSSPLLQEYDTAFWLDADVLICPDAQDPFDLHSPDLISMARDVGSPLAYEPSWFKKRWSCILCDSLQKNHGSFIDPLIFSHPDYFSYLQLWGFSQYTRPLFNTGLIVFTPSLHCTLFSDIYHRWTDGGPGALYEMIPLNLELFQRKLINEIPSSFNQLAGVHHAVWSFYPFQVQQLHQMPFTSKLTVNCFFDGLMKCSSFLHFAGAQQLMINYLQYCESDDLIRSRLSISEVN